MDQKPGPTAFWKNETERVRAHRVREVHPNWTNTEIQAFMNDEDIKVKEAFRNQRGVKSKAGKSQIYSIPYDEFVDNHRVPTGYVSSLTDEQWINYYLKDDLLVGGSLYNTQVEISDHFDLNLWAAADVWRGVGKTILMFGKGIRKSCDNPNLKLYIICDDKPRAIARLGVIKQIFQQNRLIINDYGYLPHDKMYKGYKGKWTAQKILLKRDIIAQEPSFTAFTQNSSAILGYHFDGGIIDDPWSDTLERQKDAKKKWLSWFQGTFLGCIEAGAFNWLLFTRKGPDDLYQDIIYQQGLFTPFKKPAIQKYPSSYTYVYDAKGFPIKDTTPRMPFYPKGYGTPKVLIKSKDGIISDACHGRFSMEYLLGKRKQQGPNKFEQEYQGNPVAEEGSLLDWNALKFYNDPSFKIEDKERLVEKSGSWVAFMDQGFSLSEDADFTVLTVWAWYGGRLYFHWMYRGKWRTAGKINIVKQCFDEFPNLTQIGIESDLTQMETTLLIKEGCPGIPVIPVVQGGPGKKYNEAANTTNRELDGKVLRIHDQWTPGLTNRNIYINRLMPHFTEFEHEFKFLGRAKHDDIPDSGGGALHMLKVYNTPRFYMSGTGSGYVNQQMF